ncbi:hypothetical protein ACHAXH_009636 [Discostella pseudostelligera]
MSCPPLHINRLSLDSNGWIIQEVAGNDGITVIEKPILPRCQRLLDALQLSLSSDVFSTTNGTTANDGAGAGSTEGDVVMVEPLDNLVHQVGLVDKIISAIEEIRRLGNKRGKGNRHRVGKVASLENQRRLRQQNEQKKLVQQASTMTTSTTTTQEDGEKALEQPDEDEEIVDDDDDHMDEFEVPELRLAGVFNSIRVVIDITRPILDHPQCQDLGLQMKNGPSIQISGDKNRYYLLSKNVYFCASSNGWRRLKLAYKNLLEELQEGLTARMSKQVGGGRYELAAKDWVANLFNHEQLLNKEHVASRCMELPTLNSEVASKLNAALIDRFDNDRDGKHILLQRSINKLHQHLTRAISRRFNGARLTVYGSCLSGLALEGSHDVDISIYLPQLDRLKQDFDGGTISAAEYEKKMRKTIFNVRDILQSYRSEQFLNLFAVTRARVPVIKGSMIAQKSLAFDLCFLNEIAVVNSSLLKEYSLFDKNVRLLMLSVKSFAKKNGIASAAEGTLSSYSWLNLVVFYLQCIGMVPVLNCPKMMESHGLQYDPSNPWHSINGLQTLYLTKDDVKKNNIWQRAPHAIHTNPAMLLYGYFNFYSSIFPHQTVAASIRFGEMSLQKTCLHQSSKLWRICVEDPFETCDSHCPHDLGCHVLENGQKKITACLKQAKSMLGKMLQNDMAKEGDLSKLLSQLLWSTTNSKNVNAKGSVGNQNKPAGGQQGGNKHQNDHRNRASRQNAARQPQSAAHQPHDSHAKIVPNAQNASISPREKIVPNAQNGMGVPTPQNTRVVPNAHTRKIAPNAQIRKHGVNTNVPPTHGGMTHIPADGEKYNIRVGNLSYDTTWKELKDFFCRIGEVERSDIATNSRGRSMGFGFIRYYSAEDAKRAIVELNGVQFMGRPMEVKMGNVSFKK